MQLSGLNLMKMTSVLKGTWAVLCLRFAGVLAKNVVFIFLHFLIFCFPIFQPKNAAMHLCLSFLFEMQWYHTGKS